MNDEIKEILDKLQYGFCSQLTYEKLLDYITNLQQENERLKLEIERLNDVLSHKPDEKILLKTTDGKELFIVQSERIDMQEELNKANMQLMAQLEDYKSRCEKANEFIELYTETTKVDNVRFPFELKELNLSTACRERLLNILNGKE